jgi:hypothetical protein
MNMLVNVRVQYPDIRKGAMATQINKTASTPIFSNRCARGDNIDLGAAFSVPVAISTMDSPIDFTITCADAYSEAWRIVFRWKRLSRHSAVEPFAENPPGKQNQDQEQDDEANGPLNVGAQERGPNCFGHTQNQPPH